MSRPRFFIQSVLAPSAAEAFISESDLHHAVRVLRLRPGEEIDVVDGAGTELTVALTELSYEKVGGKILSRQVHMPESLPRIELIQGLPRGSKMEEIIQKSVELGVDAVRPVYTKNSQVKLDAKSSQKKTERWCKISEMAASQSGRTHIPDVFPPQSIRQLLEVISLSDTESDPALTGKDAGPASEGPVRAVANLIAWEGEKDRLFSDYIGSGSGLAETAVLRVFVGPEGGFMDEEVTLLREHSFVTVGLGRRILRTETAGPAVLAALAYALRRM